MGACPSHAGELEMSGSPPTPAIGVNPVSDTGHLVGARGCGGRPHMMTPETVREFPDIRKANRRPKAEGR